MPRHTCIHNPKLHRLDSPAAFYINRPGPRSLLHAYLSAHGSKVAASASFPSSCFPAAVFLFRGGTRDTQRKDREGSPRLHSHRLRGVVRGEVQVVIEAEPMQAGVRDVLCAVQLRAAGDVRELRKLPLLWTDDHPWWPTQVPLIGSVLFAKKKLCVMEREKT